MCKRDPLTVKGAVFKTVVKERSTVSLEQYVRAVKSNMVESRF